MCNEYNGYANYFTWVTALWIDNDQGTQEYWQERASTQSIYDLANELKDHYEEAANELNPGANVFSDWLGHCLSSIDWHEIAETLQPEDLSQLCQYTGEPIDYCDCELCLGEIPAYDV